MTDHTVPQLGACHFTGRRAPAWKVFAFLFCALSVSPLFALTLYPERLSASDLVVRGQSVGIPEGQKRYLRHAELLGLPTTLLKVHGEFSEGTQTVRALFLSDLWSALPCDDQADTILATCKDGYASIFRKAFVQEYRPFLILQIEERDPETWAVGRPAFNPGPYVITVSADVVSGVATLLDSSHKRPWGVTEIEVTRFTQRFHALYAPPREMLSPAGNAGRELWVNSCYSCHAGPPGAPGGTKSDRPFAVLALQASQNPDYFKKYIRGPQAMNPSAKMEKHEYTEAQFAEMIAFITADGKAKPGQ